MKKYFHYIKDTILCRFSKQFLLNNAKVKWIKYHTDISDRIKICDSVVIHSFFECKGGGNDVIISHNAKLSRSSISVTGYNNKVILEGCSCGLNLIVRGNDCTVYIGRDTIMENCYMVCMGYGNSITIGNDGMFAGDVEIWNTDSHLITDLNDNFLNSESTPISIGNHVWLGKHTRILKGVTISDNSIVGMSSVVTKDIPSNSIAAGNPAKIIKNNILWRKKFITRWFGDVL